MAEFLQFFFSGLTVGDTGTDIPAAKFYIMKSYVTSSGQTVEQFLTADALRGEMQNS